MRLSTSIDRAEPRVVPRKCSLRIRATIWMRCPHVSDGARGINAHPLIHTNAYTPGYHATLPSKEERQGFKSHTIRRQKNSNSACVIVNEEHELLELLI
jgi:hypothetical protein